MALDRVDGFDRRRVLGLFAGVGLAGVTGGLSACSTLPGGVEQPKSTIKLGLLVPATGANKALGADLEKGFRLYLDENEGSLSGHPIELVVEDEGDTIESGTKALEALHASGSQAVVGIANYDLVPAVRDMVEKSQIPLIAAHGTPHDLSSAVYIWHTAFVNSEPGRAVGLYLKSLNKQRVGLIGVRDSFTEDSMNGLSNEHGSVTDKIWITPTTKLEASSFRTDAERVLALGPDVIFCSVPGAYLVPLLQALRSAGLGDRDVYAPGVVSETLAADQLAEVRNLYTATQYSSDLNNPANRNFSALYQTRHGGSPTAFAVAAYDAATILDGAIALCGDDTITPLRLNQEITRVGQVVSPRGNWQFNQSRSPQQKWYLRQVRLDGPVWSNVLIGDLATLGTN